MRWLSPTYNPLFSSWWGISPKDSVLLFSVLCLQYPHVRHRVVSYTHLIISSPAKYYDADAHFTGEEIEACNT